jgi:hypothetical protein
MILSDFILLSRQNDTLTDSGLDSKQNCIDQKHFDSYPYAVEYRYNSRGFRDDEWPTSVEELKNCIWCFGDSFTVGVGSAIDHTWVNILQQRTGIRCINVSMDGASNDWIARKVNRVIETIQPTNIVIHWSFLHRGESPNDHLIDEHRKIFDTNVFEKDQFNNFKKNLVSVEQYNKEVNIIHSLIPLASEIFEMSIDEIWNLIKGFHWPGPPEVSEEFDLIRTDIVRELQRWNLYDRVKWVLAFNELFAELADRFIPHFDKLDLSRDGFHYDRLTANNFVDSIIGRLNVSSS